MKKIIAIFVMLVLTISAISVIGTSSKNFEGIIKEENNEENDDFNYNYEDFPVMEMPPKSAEALALMDRNPQPSVPPENLPSQFTWLDYGGDWSSPAKDQMNCGSCWDFSALGALEAAINIGSGYSDLDIDLSEQYVLACLSAAGDCGGGWMSEAIAYIQSTNDGPYGNGMNGCTIESCMPYTGHDNVPCEEKCDDWNYITDPPTLDNKLWQVTDYGVSSFSEDDPDAWDTMKSWVYSHGPIVVDIYVGGWGSYWSNNNDPDDVYENDDYGITNHGVVICGWVDDSEIVNGGYWIIKNSWGTNWGYNGFGNIAYGCNSVGTRDVTWVEATKWPEEQAGPGPIDIDMAVFANFIYKTQDGTQFLHPNEKVTFKDTSNGDVSLCEWDFNNDGIIDSTDTNPEWTFNSEGEYKVKLTVFHEWGISNNRTKILSVKENWPPEPQLPSEYVGNTLTYSFDGRYSYDPDGDIESYLWEFDDGTSSDEKYITHQFPEPNQIYQVKLTLTDNDGDSASDICVLKVDQTVPPVTEAVYAPIGSVDIDWYKTTPRFILDATDWTEVISTYYRLNGGDWQDYNSGQLIPISSEGIHDLEFYSVDYYGNVEEIKLETVRIDKTLPTLELKIDGAEQINGWYVNPIDVEISAKDQLSGLDSIKYSLDYSSWVTYSGPLIINQGHHILKSYSIDNAGNMNILESPLHIKVDAGSPETSCKLIGEGNNDIFYKSVEIMLSPVDEGSGIEKTYYTIGSETGDFIEYDQPITINEIGEHKITYYSVDRVGNVEEEKTTSFKISDINFDMDITHPEKSLYIFGYRLFNLGKPLIIGPLTIKIEIKPYTSGNVDLDIVEIFIDDVSKIKLTDSPYVWELNERLLGGHELKVIAYTSEGLSREKTLSGTFFIF